MCSWAFTHNNSSGLCYAGLNYKMSIKMNKNIDAQTWEQIRQVVAQAQRASMHCSIARAFCDEFNNPCPNRVDDVMTSTLQ